MTPIIFQDAVFLDCSQDPNSSECNFRFKGKEIYLKHTLEIINKQGVHQLVCKIDGQSFTFGVGLSTLSVGPFGTWPEIKIDGNKYRFKISWSTDESTKGIKLEKLEKPLPAFCLNVFGKRFSAKLADLLEALACK